MLPKLNLRLSYSGRLMLVILALCCLPIAISVIFQYQREKEFSARMLDAQLQVVNTSIMDHIDDGYSPVQWMPGLDLPIKDLRITIFDRRTGIPTYDNINKQIARTSHLDRPEIKAALAAGSYGRAYEARTSRSSDHPDEEYFYSVLIGSDVIVRTGAPYHSVSVGKFLEGDRTYLWVMLASLVLTTIIIFFTTKHIGGTIRRLSQFARSAEAGERLYDSNDFPKNELGIISHHIVRLFVKLQQTTAERDRQQLMLMEEESGKQRMKRDLTNNINHELKTPVASIQVTLEALQEHPDLPEAKRNQLLDRCASNARRLASLLRDISTITRIDEGATLIQREPIDLARLIEGVIDDATTRAEDKGMTLYASLDETMVMQGNNSLLESIFRNLIENAIAYSGGTKLTISVLESNADLFTLVVADDGCGIPEQHLPRLFERFYRIDKGRSRGAGGTGLGLAIVKNAVQFHGGDIEVRNRPTGGLEFIITLQRDYMGGLVPEGSSAKKPAAGKVPGLIDD